MDIMVNVIMGYFALLDKIQGLLIQRIYINSFDRINGANYQQVVFHDIPINEQLSPISPIGRISIRRSKWPLDLIPIMGVCQVQLTISVQTDSVKVESVVRCGQCCTPCTTVTTLGNGCDIMTQRLHIWSIIGGWHFTINPWDGGSPWGTGVYLQVRLLSCFEPSCSKSNVVDLIYSHISGRKRRREYSRG